jgi:hypothetical protein
LSSRIGGSRPSSNLAASLKVHTFFQFFRSGVRFDLSFAMLLFVGVLFIACAGSPPSVVTNAATSRSFSSSFDLISPMWLANFVLRLDSTSLCSRSTCSRSPRFSARRRDISFSRFRIRTHCVELARAISLFWREYLRRTRSSLLSACV